MMNNLQWTSNDICFDPETKIILGQVTCNGTNQFKAMVKDREIGKFIDRQSAIDAVLLMLDKN